MFQIYFMKDDRARDGDLRMETPRVYNPDNVEIVEFFFRGEKVAKVNKMGGIFLLMFVFFIHAVGFGRSWAGRPPRRRAMA